MVYKCSKQNGLQAPGYETRAASCDFKYRLVIYQVLLLCRLQLVFLSERCTFSIFFHLLTFVTAMLRFAGMIKCKIRSLLIDLMKYSGVQHRGSTVITATHSANQAKNTCLQIKIRVHSKEQRFPPKWLMYQFKHPRIFVFLRSITHSASKTDVYSDEA